MGTNPDGSPRIEYLNLSAPGFKVWAKGGTTIGNVFITENQFALGDADLLRHETHHTYQWAAGGGTLAYALAYGAQYLMYGECNKYEADAGYADGDYDECL